MLSVIVAYVEISNRMPPSHLLQGLSDFFPGQIFSSGCHHFRFSHRSKFLRRGPDHDFSQNLAGDVGEFATLRANRFVERPIFARRRFLRPAPKRGKKKALAMIAIGRISKRESVYGRRFQPSLAANTAGFIRDCRRRQKPIALLENRRFGFAEGAPACEGYPSTLLYHEISAISLTPLRCSPGLCPCRRLAAMVRSATRRGLAGERDYRQVSKWRPQGSLAHPRQPWLCRTIGRR